MLFYIDFLIGFLMSPLSAYRGYKEHKRIWRAAIYGAVTTVLWPLDILLYVVPVIIFLKYKKTELN